ncbi:MAG: DUF4394 domain-containing protein [bacterium]
MKSRSRLTLGSRCLRLVPAGLLSVAALLASPASSRAQEGAYCVSTTNTLMVFDTATPGSITYSVPVTGLMPGENILAVDFRPKAPVGRLYGLGSSSRLYEIDRVTGVATAIGAGPFSPPLNGAEFGMDFNPTVDRIRIISDLDQNLRAHPDLGTIVAVDSTLRYAAADPNFGEDPYCVAAAYTNSFDPPPATTTLYDVETVFNLLATQSPPNNGVLNTVGALGVNPSNVAAFDISGATGVAYAAFNNAAGVSSLYALDISTGSATLLGAIAGGQTIRSMSIFGEPPPNATEATTWGAIKGIYR